MYNFEIAQVFAEVLLWTEGTFQSQTVDVMAADDLAIQEARASANMVLI